MTNPLPYDPGQRYTIMSYQPMANIPGFAEWWATKPMLYDILAIQTLYGVNPNTAAGSNNTYHFKTGADAVQAIWDANGTDDTISAFDQSQNVTIDLQPGHFSFVGVNEETSQQQIAIAYQVAGYENNWIENAIGGGGDDILIGNGAANRLEGGAGFDVYRVSNLDTIHDNAKGQGKVLFDTIELHGGTREPGETDWHDAQGHIYTRLGDKLLVANSDKTSTIMIEYFHNDDLGIHLNDPATPINPATAKSFNAATLARAPISRDPLIFDLNGNGIESTGISATNPIMFDMDADGVKTATGWIGANDAFLALDRNGNGVIDDGRELFGDAVIKSDSQFATDGFDALRDLDSNADGKIDSTDSPFANLRLWRDLNQDGLSQSDELVTLDSQQIAAINVDSSVHSQILSNGNQLADFGSFIRIDGSGGAVAEVTGNLGDINLVQNTFVSQFTDRLDTSAVANLPNIQGAGQVRSLQEAATLSATLMQLLNDFTAADTRGARQSLLDPIIKAWSDTSTMATTFTGAYDGHNLTVTIQGATPGSSQYNAWADKLTLLEHFNGRTFNPVPAGTADASVILWTTSQALLQQSYDALKQTVYESLTRQTYFKPLLDSIAYTATANGAVLDFSAVQQVLQAKIDADPVQGISDLIEFNLYAQSSLGGIGWNGWTMLEDTLRHTAVTPELQALYNSFGVKVEGVTDFSWDGTIVPHILLGGAADNILWGNLANDMLFGGAGNDVLHGNDGNDVLAGGAGNDQLDGGAGNDLYLFGRGDGQDIILNSYDDAAGRIDKVQMSADVAPADVALSRDGDNLVIAINGTADTMTVNDYFVGDGVTGAGRIDALMFADGTTWTTADINRTMLQATAGDDVRYAYITPDIMDGLAGDDSLYGMGGNDTIAGGDGNDLLDGGTGADSMAGGAGDDTYVIDNVGDLVTEAFNSGNDTVVSSIDYVLGDNLENLTLSGNLAISGTGNVDDNRLIGNYAPNTLSGGLGNDYLDGSFNKDVMIGGAGDDTYVVGYSEDVVVENPDEGIDVVLATTNYVLSANVENLILEEEGGRIGGTGNAGANHIIGNRNNNRLDGGAGADILEGGDGNDTYVIDNVMDQIIESAAGGNDTVESSITYMLGDSLENLALTGLEDLNAFGNSGNNLITGNSGNNRIDGGQGADTMAGGAGNDVYVTDNEGDRINESAGQGIDTVERTNDTLLILDNNVENLMLMGTVVHGNGNDLDNAITGNGADNILMGLGGNDTLEGGAGNDALFGGTGADTLIGGTGEDYYQVDDVGDIVIEAAGEGGDFVRSSMSYTLTDNVESLALDGTVDLAATGNGLNNGLWGNAGNNTLSGLAGNDYLVGQAGNDVYLFGRGDGLDTIDNTDLLIATDTLRFGAGIADTDVLALQSGTDLVLKIKGGSDQIDVYNYYGADTITGNNVYDHKIDRVEFANGVVWDQAALQVQVDRSTYNHSPTVNAYLPTLQSYVDTLFSYTVPADTIVDSDAGDSISYSTTLADGSALPSWLSFDAASRTFSGTPSASQVGSLSFILWGTDNYGYSAGEYVTLTTALPNHAPVLSNALADQSASQGAAFTYTVPAGAFTDPDAGDTLSYGATLADGSTLPSWLAFNASTRAFSGTPTTLGSVSVRVTATDAGGLKVSDVFDIVVSVQNLALNGTSGADSLIGGYGNDTLNGLAGNDTLIGSAGNDVLDGGAGNDSLKGGVGDDIYIVDSTADVVVENVNEGLDVVQAGVSYVLTNNVENLLLIGTSAISGTGNALDNILTGNSAANTLTGGAGNDRLDGKGGADKLIGGTGNDVYVVDVATDAITENANEGTDTVESGVTFTLGSNLENLVLMGATAINGTGNTLNNVLIGNSAANTLSGGTGADTMNGVAGDDVYVVDNIWDVVSENPNEGNDLVQAGVTYTLAADVENLTLTGTNAINGTGNMLGNTIIGNTAANILNGGVGNDTLTGGSGADRFQFTTTLGTDNIDTITDFVSGTDKIDLSKAIFTAFGSLTVGSSLGNAEIGNHVLYDAATGFLCYDADGSAGAGAAVQILLLGTTNHPATLKGGDFIIAA